MLNGIAMVNLTKRIQKRKLENSSTLIPATYSTTVSIKYAIQFKLNDHTHKLHTNQSSFILLTLKLQL